MQTTKEIRWFFRDENESVQKWLDDQKNKSILKSEDKHLFFKCEDMGITIKNEQLEIKRRLGIKSTNCLATNAWGFTEHWNTWTFPVKDNLGILTEILEGEHPNWISFHKTSYSIQLKKDGNTIKPAPMSMDLDNGYIMEYTKILVEDDTWYTMSFTSFGEFQFSIEASFMKSLLGNTQLSMKESMSYPIFISRCCKSKIEIKKYLENNTLKSQIKEVCD